MHTRLLSAAALVLLAGCGWGAENVIENQIERQMGGDAEVEIDDGTMHIATSEGQVDVGGGLPKNWPKDVPLYPDATVQFSGTNTPTDGTQELAVILQATAAPATVADYYAKALVEQGWTVESSMNAGPTSAVVAKKDDRTVSVGVTGAEGSTMITLGVQSAE